MNDVDDDEDSFADNDDLLADKMEDTRQLKDAIHRGHKDCTEKFK
jgi:hypothetical protein